MGRWGDAASRLRSGLRVGTAAKEKEGATEQAPAVTGRGPKGDAGWPPWPVVRGQPLGPVVQRSVELNHEGTKNTKAEILEDEINRNRSAGRTVGYAEGPYVLF